MSVALRSVALRDCRIGVAALLDLVFTHKLAE
jgi:hypothetical protein